MVEILVTLVLSSLISLGVYIYKRDPNSTKNEVTILETLKTLEAELNEVESEIRALIPADDAIEIVTLLEEFENLGKLEKSKLNIANLEVTSLENRLREFTDIEQELENSSIETKEIEKGFRANLNEVIQRVESLKQNTPVFEESVNKLGLAEENEALLIRECLGKFEEFFEYSEKSIDIICSLKTRFDALDIEFAELFEKFGELDV